MPLRQKAKLPADRQPFRFRSSLFFLLPFVLLLSLWLITPPARVGAEGKADQQLVLVAPYKGTVDAAMVAFFNRALQEAERVSARYVLVELTTLGGTLDAALDLRDLFLASPVPVAVFVPDRAWSAGSLLAIAGEKLIMAPGASIGAAEPRPAEEKIVSAWRGELEATAEKRGRNPLIAGAMAGAVQDLPGIIEKGKILTLTANRARELGFSDATAGSREEAIAALGLKNPNVTIFTPSWADLVARYVTNPAVAPLLLLVGFVGLLVELFLPGWGIFGTLGLLSLLLYFGGHMLAGLAGWETLALFALGIILLAIEAFIPGFGIFGFGGIVAVLTSIYLAAPSPQQALASIAVALLGTVVTGYFLARYGRRRGWWRDLILGAKETNRQGYVPRRYRPELVGKTGVVVTPLRPAGMAEIDGERVDVVSDGQFIPRGAWVKVIKVEGTRALVAVVGENRSEGKGKQQNEEGLTKDA